MIIGYFSRNLSFRRKEKYLSKLKVDYEVNILKYFLILALKNDRFVHYYMDTNF